MTTRSMRLDVSAETLTNLNILRSYKQSLELTEGSIKYLKDQIALLQNDLSECEQDRMDILENVADYETIVTESFLPILLDYNNTEVLAESRSLEIGDTVTLLRRYNFQEIYLYNTEVGDRGKVLDTDSSDNTVLVEWNDKSHNWMLAADVQLVP